MMGCKPCEKAKTVKLTGPDGATRTFSTTEAARRENQRRYAGKGTVSGK